MIFKFNRLILGLLFSTSVMGAPTILLETPANDVTTSYQASVTFTGTVKNATSLTLNGFDIPINTFGQFHYTVSLKAENDNNYFLLEASDGAASTSMHRIVYYNATRSDTADPVPQTASERETLRQYIGVTAKGSYIFAGISLSDFITIFAKEHQLNIINTIESDKRITVELNNMHPADVFDILINYWGCHWILSDQIIKIVHQSPVRVFQLNYLKGEEFIQLVDGMSNIAQFKTNPIDNSIVAQGSVEDLDYLETLIERLDVRPKQVLIEATIIETNVDLSTVFGTKPSSISRTIGTSNSPFNLQTLGYSFSMSLFENNANVNVLANPQILVTNHKTASINTGNQTGYTTTTVTQTSTIENMNFLTTGITLEITPHISETDDILMELNPSISEGHVNQNTPISSRTSTKTQVVIKDGETIVIGGLIQKKKTSATTKIPIISNIPILNLFISQKETAEKKTELSVLITPHIIDATSADDTRKVLR